MGRRPRGTLTETARQQYQRAYYLAHREKAREYQKTWYLLHRKKSCPSRGREAEFEEQRQQHRQVVIAVDLQNLQGSRFAAVVNSISTGDGSTVLVTTMRRQLKSNQQQPQGVVCDGCGWFCDSILRQCPNCGACLACES